MIPAESAGGVGVLPTPPAPLSEGQRMALELARVLKATGQYDVALLAEQSAACGWPMHRTLVSAILNGRRYCSVYAVEHLALAAGVDLAYLY